MVFEEPEVSGVVSSAQAYNVGIWIGAHELENELSVSLNSRPSTPVDDWVHFSFVLKK